MIDKQNYYKHRPKNGVQQKSQNGLVMKRYGAIAA